MATPTAYFDLLEDGLVEEVIRRMDQRKYPNRGWLDLAASSRRLCTLARRARTVKFSIRDLDGLLDLLDLPPDRAWHNVKELSIDCYDAFSEAEEWGCFTDALASAVTAWPGMQDLRLEAKLYTGPPGNHFGLCDPGCLSGPLLALRNAPALRRLELVLHESTSLIYVPELTQLTHLHLIWQPVDDCFITAPGGRRPLAGMTGLVSLGLFDADVELEGPSALPPNLTRLEMRAPWQGVGNWAVHLGGCQQLRELQLELPWGEVAVHPTLLIRGIAEQLTGLVKLSIDFNADGDAVDEQQVLADMLAEVEGEEAVGEDDFLQLPLVMAGTEPAPPPYIMIPPPNMGALSSLQHLDVGRWWLVATSERHWRALASCSSLRRLKGLHASVPPPAGLTVPQLTELWVKSSTSLGDTLALLAAFPALQTLRLTVVPPDSVSDEPPVAQPVVTQRLSSARIAFQWPPQLSSAGAQAPFVAGYCCRLWAALPGLRVAALAWPSPVARQTYTEAEHAAAERRNAALRLGAVQEREGPPVHVQAGQVLPVLQGATQLQVLDLRMELDPSSKGQLVLGVLEALPGLTRLGVLDGEEGLAPATVAALRPGLLHDLTARFWEDPYYLL